MRDEARTIDEEIDRIAHRTGASEQFVRKVKRLFTVKGISLDGDSAPYRRALEHAFDREAAIRSKAAETRAYLSGLHTNLVRLDRAWKKNLRSLRETKGALQAGSRRPRRGAVSRRIPVERPGVRFERIVDRDIPPLVPGPDEVQ